MTEKAQLIVSLLHKRINGLTLTDTEKKELEDWVSLSEHNRRLYDEVTNSEIVQEEVKSLLNYDSKSLWKKIKSELPSKKNNLISFFSHRSLRYAAAAVLLIFISTIVYILFVNPNTSLQQAKSEKQPAVIPDLPPGTENAILTLDDGKTLVLDKNTNGKIAEEGNTIIVKEEGLLAYNTNNKTTATGVFYNTLTTSKAGYYSSLVLADGSKVWLDAQSSIRYPTSFDGKDRLVDVTGQVYFEVAKNPAKPFKVNVKDKSMTVEVVGTHFNVNAYSDDEAAVRTTLLEGAVKILYGDNRASFLKPGQQANLARSGEFKIINDADTEETVAWKNGTFLFKKESLESIMKQVSRWYGVEVIFQDKIPGQFVATLPRNVSVSRLLKIFEMAGGVHFEIDDTNRKITVRR